MRSLNSSDGCETCAVQSFSWLPGCGNVLQWDNLDSANHVSILHAEGSCAFQVLFLSAGSWVQSGLKDESQGAFEIQPRA